MVASFNLRVDMAGALKIVLLYHSGMCFLQNMYYVLI